MIFKESQKFAPWALWMMRGILALVGLLFIFLYMTAPVSGVLLLVIFIFAVAPPMLLLEVIGLKTQLGTEGINIALKPFTKKYFAWSEIESAEMIDYGFVGGWGIRMGTKYGTVYNAQGSEGLLLTLKNGKSVVIGTQRRAALQAAVNKTFQS